MLVIRDEILIDESIDLVEAELMNAIKRLLALGMSTAAIAATLTLPVSAVDKIAKETPTIVQKTTSSSKQKEEPPVVQAKKISLDDIVDAIIKHEGLVKGQTPFRITNPSMKNWNTIHGLEIDKDTPKPVGRENFIFLKDASKVADAIKAQFKKYAKYPARYGFKGAPSLIDALAEFDQSGLSGKVAFILSRIPELNGRADLDKPLTDYIESRLT